MEQLDMQQQEQCYRLLLHCGAQRTPADLCRQLVRELNDLVPYDQARVLFLDRTGRISDYQLFGANERQWKEFMYYYEHDLVFSKYSMRKEPLRLSQEEKVSAHNYWYAQEESPQDKSIFVDDYVRSLHLYHSLGIGFGDQENCIRSIITLDRTRDLPFTHREIHLVRKLHPLLENYHIDLLLKDSAAAAPLLTFQQQYFLTKRETEIVGLLLEGLTPALIARRLCVSVSTVYRHIANIYQKAHISNRQNLYRLFSRQ